MAAFEGKTIAVVGGGPGGLTLARLLEMRGADVTVYERDRDRSARITGSALDLHEDSGLAALAEAGLMEGFWARYRPELDRLRLMNDQAEVLYDFMRGEQNGVRRPEIERAPLRDLLLDSLKPETVRWDKRLAGANSDGNGVTLTFADGTTATADLVIGADGANSRLRSVVTEIRPTYVGVTLLEGTVANAKDAVPEMWEMVGGSALIALGHGQTLAMATKQDGSLLFYAGLKATKESGGNGAVEAADGDARVAWFRANFPAWSARWEALFRESGALLPRLLQVCPSDQHWAARSDVTLIGDAAHVMPPYAGEGVNMAMLDALVLARALRSEGSVQAAVQAYEEEMFARTGTIAAMTMENTEMFYAPDASERVVGMFQSFASQAAAAALAAELQGDAS